jgi:hypothetical protein
MTRHDLMQRQPVATIAEGNVTLEDRTADALARSGRTVMLRGSDVASIAVNEINTNSVKDLPGASENDKKNETMSEQSERRGLVPVIIAGIVAAVGLFCLWSDLSDDSLGRGDGVITSAVASRAGVIVTPSEKPAHLSAPQTAPAFERATVGRGMH